MNKHTNIFVVMLLFSIFLVNTARSDEFQKFCNEMTTNPEAFSVSEMEKAYNKALNKNDYEDFLFIENLIYEHQIYRDIVTDLWALSRVHSICHNKSKAKEEDLFKLAKTDEEKSRLEHTLDKQRIERALKLKPFCIKATNYQEDSIHDNFIRHVELTKNPVVVEQKEFLLVNLEHSYDIFGDHGSAMWAGGYCQEYSLVKSNPWTKEKEK